MQVSDIVCGPVDAAAKVHMSVQVIPKEVTYVDTVAETTVTFQQAGCSEDVRALYDTDRPTALPNIVVVVMVRTHMLPLGA